MSDKSLDIFLQNKSSMMALAYRMLGTISEAEEVVQEVYIDWQKQDPSLIENPKGWLLTVCSRTSIDALKRSYKKREVYSGPWLPEPVIDGFEHWQESSLETYESLTMAFLLLLEKLNPVERAVYLLHDVFGHSFSETSSIVEKSEANCRKIAERARKYIQENRSKYDKPSGKDVVILQRFFETLKKGDVGEVKALFTEHPEFWSDGGGKATAVPRVLSDSQQISKFFINIMKQNYQGARAEFASINGRQGVILSSQNENSEWTFQTVFSFEFHEGKISRIFAVRNPDKFTLLSKR